MFSALVLSMVYVSSCQADCIILLHGLARSEGSMKPLERHLVKAGYIVVNVGYPSRKHGIAALASDSLSSAIAECPSGGFHVVTHSMGGILVREYMNDPLRVSEIVGEKAVRRLKRVVMLGPPNSGSEVVDTLGNYPGFHFLNGDAGMQLGAGLDSVPNKLGPASFDVGIIAGNKSVSPVLSKIIPGPDDGKVSVESTRLAGMKDHIVLPVTHTFMMKNSKVMDQVVFYIQNGRFKR
ncbi:MAG: pimeloyl-ACP methyl ester carboxylesterase [Flavobacteriales bacterium]|jgi:pimeloyl-ACP methyl ester carboxylesterase